MSNKKSKKSAGRPPKNPKDRLVAVPFRVHTSVVAAIEQLAKARFRSRTDVIRDALIAYLAAQGYSPLPTIVLGDDGRPAMDIEGLSPEEITELLIEFRRRQLGVTFEEAAETLARSMDPNPEK